MRFKKIIYPALMILFVFLPGGRAAFAEDAVILIDPKEELGPVNKKVFGNNFIGYDPVTYETWTREYYGYSDYGAGIWDPGAKRCVQEAIDLARESGMTTARFPGGCGAHHYDWKEAIGANREHFLYGIDEFLKTCEEIGAEPVITVSYFTGEELDAAELVEYLNVPAGQGHPWADERLKNGHPRPYRVTYFEIGNEVWHGDHQKIKEVAPGDYARRYLKYYERMKAADPSIKIGVILYTDEWNREVLDVIGDRADFGILHIYPRLDADEAEMERKTPQEIFGGVLGVPLAKEEAALSRVAALIKERSKKAIPLAVTEYNTGLGEDDPLFYRHRLGSALLNAELLRIFMKPAYGILMAHYWQFLNDYWGMAENGFDGDEEDLYDPYNRRPNFYVFQLYHRHFGDILLKVSSQPAGLSVNASKSRDGKTIYLMVVNKDMSQNISAALRIRGLKPSSRCEAWVLNASRVEASNEDKGREVGVRRISCDPAHVTFEPHSLTAIEIEKG